MKTTLLAQLPPDVLTVMSLGQTIVGASVSATVTVKEQALVLPTTSVAVQVTVVVPLVNVVPLVGVQLTVTPGQLSVALGTAKFTRRVH